MPWPVSVQPRFSRILWILSIALRGWEMCQLLGWFNTTALCVPKWGKKVVSSSDFIFDQFEDKSWSWKWFKAIINAPNGVKQVWFQLSSSFPLNIMTTGKFAARDNTEPPIWANFTLTRWVTRALSLFAPLILWTESSISFNCFFRLGYAKTQEIIFTPWPLW